MKHRSRLRILDSIGLAVATALLSGLAHAQPASLALHTYFNPATLSGRWMTDFAARANELGQGSLNIRVSSAPSNRSAFAAVREGKAALAGFYAPDLSSEMPLLGLSAVPMLASSIDDAWKLYRLARPHYEQVLATQKQVMIATMPWRPAALWSRHPLKGKTDVAQRRFYVQADRPAVSTIPLEHLGATRSDLTVADVVLATGYTGNLFTYSPNFKHFIEIAYTVQLNFITMSAAAFAGLPKVAQEAIIAAGRQMEEKEWAATKSLVIRDHNDMAAKGVTVMADAPADLLAALREAAERDIATWASANAPVGLQIVEAHRGRGAAQTTGATEIQRLLLAQPVWVSSWTPTKNENWSAPIGTGLAQFVVRDGKLYENFENRLLNQKCTSEVLLHDDGLTRFGCTNVPKRLKFDAKVAQHPFTGIAPNGYSYRLSPGP